MTEQSLNSIRHGEMISEAIKGPDEATAEWITDVLRQSRCLPRGRILSLSRVKECSYTSTIVRLRPVYSADAPSTSPQRLLLKLSRPDSGQTVVGGEQRRREVMFHIEVAAAMPSPPVVRCHHAGYCEETGAASLLFDDVSATHSAGRQSSPPPLPEAESAIEALASFHAFWWDHDGLGKIDELPDDRSVAELVAINRERFPEFADALGPRLTDPQRRVYEKVLTALPRLWSRISGGKDLTLIHGDANFSNLLLPHSPDSDRALIIDWQLYGISFAAEDLAHLMALFWNREQRQVMEKHLLKRYHQGLLLHGVDGYDWDDCWQDYRLSVILRVLFMPMWFWVTGSPASWWLTGLDRAMEAVEDLRCLELLETQ